MRPKWILLITPFQNSRFFLNCYHGLHMLTGLWLIDMAYRQSRSAWKIGGGGTGWYGQSWLVWKGVCFKAVRCFEFFYSNPRISHQFLLEVLFSKRMLLEIGQGTTDIPSLIHTGVPIVAWRRERSRQRHGNWGLIDLRSQVWSNTKSRLMMIINIIIIVILHYYHY